MTGLKNRPISKVNFERPSERLNLVSTCGCCCCFLLKGLDTLLDLKELNLADNIIEKIGMFSE